MARKKTGAGQTAPAKRKAAEIMPVNDFFDVENTGMENMGAEDLAIPFLRIAQGLSAQLDIDDTLRAGMFFNTATGTNYGENPNIIVLGYFRNCVVWEGEGKSAHPIDQITTEQFKQLQADEGIKQNRRGKWVDVNEHVYEDTFNFYVLMADHPEDGAILFPCSSSAIKGAKTLNTGVRTVNIPGVKNVPIYAGVWQLTTGLTENEDGKWYKLGGPNGKDIKRVGYVHEDYKELMPLVKKSFEMAQDNIRNNVSVDYSAAKEEKDVTEF